MYNIKHFQLGTPVSFRCFFPFFFNYCTNTRNLCVCCSFLLGCIASHTQNVQNCQRHFWKLNFLEIFQNNPQKSDVPRERRQKTLPSPTMAKINLSKIIMRRTVLLFTCAPASCWQELNSDKMWCMRKYTITAEKKKKTDETNSRNRWF